MLLQLDAIADGTPHPSVAELRFQLWSDRLNLKN